MLSWWRSFGIGLTVKGSRIRPANDSTSMQMGWASELSERLPRSVDTSVSPWQEHRAPKDRFFLNRRYCANPVLVTCHGFVADHGF